MTHDAWLAALASARIELLDGRVADHQGADAVVAGVAADMGTGSGLSILEVAR